MSFKKFKTSVVIKTTVRTISCRCWTAKYTKYYNQMVWLKANTVGILQTAITQMWNAWQWMCLNFTGKFHEVMNRRSFCRKNTQDHTHTHTMKLFQFILIIKIYSFVFF